MKGVDAPAQRGWEREKRYPAADVGEGYHGRHDRRSLSQRRQQIRPVSAHALPRPPKAILAGPRSAATVMTATTTAQAYPCRQAWRSPHDPQPAIAGRVVHTMPAHAGLAEYARRANARSTESDGEDGTRPERQGQDRRRGQIPDDQTSTIAALTWAQASRTKTQWQRRNTQAKEQRRRGGFAYARRPSGKFSAICPSAAHLRRLEPIPTRRMALIRRLLDPPVESRCVGLREREPTSGPLPPDTPGLCCRTAGPPVPRIGVAQNIDLMSWTRPHPSNERSSNRREYRTWERRARANDTARSSDAVAAWRTDPRAGA